MIQHFFISKQYSVYWYRNN